MSENQNPENVPQSNLWSQGFEEIAAEKQALTEAVQKQLADNGLESVSFVNEDGTVESTVQAASVEMTPKQFVQAVNAVTSAEQQVEEIFSNLTPEQMMQNDIDTAKTPREFRKITQGTTLAALDAMRGRKGLSQEEKIAQMRTARERLVLALQALDKGIESAEQAAETE